MKHYELVKVNEQSYLAIILSVETMGAYLRSLHRDISRLDANVREVYLDFLLRNGMNNRFYKIIIRNHSFNDDSISSCIPSEQYYRLSDTFFVHNSEYIHRSVMPSSQKAKYIASLSKLLW